MKNEIERLIESLKEEINESSDINPVVTVSRKDIVSLIEVYENLIRSAEC